MNSKVLNPPLAALALMAAAGFANAPAALAQAAASAAETAAEQAKSHVANFIDLGAAAGIATNPRLGNSGGVSGLGRVSAYAVHSVVSDRDTMQLSAYAENQSYTNDYGSTRSFELAATASHKASPRLSLFGSARFRGDVGAQLYNRFVSVPAAPTPVELGNPLPALPLLDPAFVSLNRTQYLASGQAGFNYALSARDSVNGSVGYQHLFFTRGGPNLDYDVATGTVGWQRRLSERTLGGVRVLAQRVDYGAQGQSTVVSPQLTVHTQLAEGWTADAAVGASIVDEDTATRRGTNTDLSFDGSLCRRTEKEMICASASRGAQSSIGQTVNTSTTASLSYFRRLTANDTVQAGASVVRTSGRNSLLVGTQATYYSANASYNRRLSPRLSGGVEGNVSKIDQSGARSIPEQASATIYLRYRLGDLM